MRETWNGQQSAYSMELIMTFSYETKRIKTNKE